MDTEENKVAKWETREITNADAMDILRQMCRVGTEWELFMDAPNRAAVHVSGGVRSWLVSINLNSNKDCKQPLRVLHEEFGDSLTVYEHDGISLDTPVARMFLACFFKHLSESK